MGNQSREFKGIWIPKEIWLDSRLSALDKIIFAEIDSYSNGENGCYAGNDYLASFCQCSESKVSKTISKLIDLGYIKRVSFDGRKRILQSCLVNFTTLNNKNCESDKQNLPQINTDTIPSININNINPHNPPEVDFKKAKKKSRAEKKQDVEDVLHAYTQDEEVLDRLDAWLEVRKEKRSPNTVRAVKINLKKLDNMARLSKMSVPQYLDEIVARGWAAFYVINNFSKNNTNYKNNTNCNNSQKINDAPVTEHDIYGD